MEGNLQILPYYPLESGPRTQPSVQPTTLGLGQSLALDVVSLIRSFDWSVCRRMVGGA